MNSLTSRPQSSTFTITPCGLPSAVFLFIGWFINFCGMSNCQRSIYTKMFGIRVHCTFIFSFFVFLFFLDLTVQLRPLFVFSTSHYEHGTFSNAKFDSYILSVYSYCLYQSLRFFSFFANWFAPSKFFTPSFNRWSFTRIWMRASLLGSPGLF